MIFKTFDSDIDKISAKWGIFGRSFNEIGNAINDKITSIKKNLDVSNDLSGSIKNSGDSILKRLYPTKESIQSQMIDVDAVLPKIDENEANKILSIIKSIDDGTNEEIKSFQDLYDTGIKQNQWIAKYAQETQGQIRSVEGVTEANQQARQSAIKHNKALEQQTLGAKASKLAFSALATVGNVLASVLISLVVTEVIKFFDNIIHKAEYAREALEETTSELEELNSELETTKDRIKELEGKSSLTIVEKEELDRLKQYNQELEKRKKYLEMEQEKQKEEVVENAKDSYKSSHTGMKLAPGETYDGSNADYYAEQYASAKQRYQEVLNDENSTQKDLESAENNLEQWESKLLAEREALEELYDDFVNSGGTNNSEFKQIVADFATIDGLLYSPSENLKNYINSDDLAFEKRNLLKLQEEGKITEDSIEGLAETCPKINKYLEENDLSVKDLIDTLKLYEEELDNTSDKQDKTSRSAMISNLNSLSEGFEELDKIYSSIADDDPFDFKLLDDEKFKENFSGLGDVYEDFIETVVNNSDDIGACQDAFNNLVNEWIRSKDILTDVTKETKSITVGMLEQMGVTNAQEIVDEILAVKDAYEQATEEKANYSSTDLSEATADDIVALINEGNAAEETQQKIVSYWLEKEFANGINFNVTSDIQKLQSICNALGIASSAWQTYYKAKEGLTKSTKSLLSLEHSVYSNTQFSMSNGIPYADGKTPTSSLKEQLQQEQAQYQKELESATTEIESIINDLKNTSFTTPTANYSNPSDSSSKGSSSSKETKEELDWIETKLSRIQRNITNLGKTVSATYKQWSTRNKALSDEMSKVNEEISIQQQAYNKYMALANGVGLSSKYKNLVQNGSISVETITDETLADKIKEYKEFYEKALDCSDAILDLKDNLADLAKQHFENVLKEYDNQLSHFEHNLNVINNEINRIETSGYLVSAKHYEKLIAQENKNIALMQKNYDALIKARAEAMSTGQIEEFSDDWYDMTAEILDLEEALQDANTALIEYNNSLRDLKWDIFDRMLDAMSSVNSEAEFLREVLSYKDMFNDDGTYTEFGQAVQGLNAVEMNSLYAQAEEYKKELKEINKLLEEDPYNITLDERRNELQEAYYDKLTEALQKEQEMMDTEQERYDALLSYLDDAINKEKERLNTIKDQYDFEKDVSEQTKNIANLEKILASIEGDNSESNRLFKQQTTNDLKEARENLEETMYEKYVSDREKLLDNLYDEAESFVSMRMDERDQVLTDLIAGVNENAESIGNTLEETASSVGAVLSENMDSIWGTNGEFTSVVTKYSDNFTNLLTTTNSVLSSIRDKVNAMAGDSSGNKNDGASSSTTTTKPSTSTGSSSSSTSSNSTNSSSSSGKWGSWFISKKNSYNKSKLKKDVSIVDRLKYNDFDSNFSARSSYYKSMGGSGTYTGSSSQNQWMIQQMRKNGFKNGGTIGKLIKASGEDGFVLARTGEELLSREKLEQLTSALKLTEPIFDHSALIKKQIESINKMSNINNVGGTSTLLQTGDIIIEGIQTPEAFADELNNQLRTNKITQKIIQSDTIGQMLGKNSLTKHSIF